MAGEARKAAERQPTKYQLGVLKEMATGAKMHHMMGLHSYYFLGGSQRGVKWESAEIIINAGWAEGCGKNQKYQPVYAITKKGRSIAQQDSANEGE